ncbi:MAG: DNA cytosine methyltransferase [Bacteroidales bacterium]|nr:DNA cytosine methyltransferase [Bacteroidales bacterium]
MEADLCPKTPKCPIFNGILKGSEYSDTYRRLYCEAGEEGRKKCRRFQVAERVGTCPPGILPNSSKTVDQIIESMKAEGII